MSDNAHPGVRSLLAKFENSQSPITSPPSRGRSPIGSDTPGSTRPLSKVRASFVTVEGAIQSNPGSPLRKTSGQSDSPGIFGPRINAEEIESRRQNNVVSPTPGGHAKSQTGILDNVADKVQFEDAAMVTKERKVSDSQEAAPADTAQAKKEKTSSSAPSADTGVSSEKEKVAPKTVTKGASNVHTAKQNANKSTTNTTTSTSSRTTTTNGNAKHTTSAREVAKERANTLAHKPSRPSLNPTTKPTTRVTRGATPSGEAHKPTVGSTTNKPRTKSPTRPVRLPNSMTAQTQSSNAKHGSAAPAAGRTEKPATSLTRKPSSLKSAAAPTGAVRRQSSRPSLSHQPAPERPSSRVSDIGAKPVNESFLARMMRPTASSASKTHDKSEIRAPPKPTTSKAPRPSMGRASERGVAQAKTKPTAVKAQSEKSQPASKEGSSVKDEVEVSQKEQESDKENIEEAAASISEKPSVAETNDAIIEESEPEVHSQANVEDVAEKPAESTEIEAVPEVLDETVRPIQPSVEPTADEPSAGPVAANALEASNHQEEATQDVEVGAELSATLTTHESQGHEEVPDAKDMEELPVETANKTSGEKESSESQPEHEAPKDITITEAKENPEAESENPELPQHTETAKSVANDDAPEITEDVNVSQPSEKIEEPKVSIPVVESAPLAKSDTVDIDFASLALS